MIDRIIKNKIKDKRGIGWGKLFLVMCLILFGLTIFLFGKAQQRVDTSIGTDELDKVSSQNLDFYFFDSMRLAVSDFINNSAQYSFIDQNNVNCQTTPSKVIILNLNCGPDMNLLKEKAVNEIKTDINNSLKQIEIENDVSCVFENESLTCYTNKIGLSSQRDSEFFSYVVSHQFVLNETTDFDEQLNLSEINEIYSKAMSCQGTSCFLSFRDWDVKNIEKEGNYLIFSLETKREYPFKNQIERISWKFATEI